LKNVQEMPSQQSEKLLSDGGEEEIDGVWLGSAEKHKNFNLLTIKAESVWLKYIVFDCCFLNYTCVKVDLIMLKN
jgi:hypothetical protein